MLWIVYLIQILPSCQDKLLLLISIQTSLRVYIVEKSERLIEVPLFVSLLAELPEIVLFLLDII